MTFGRLGGAAAGVLVLGLVVVGIVAHVLNLNTETSTSSRLRGVYLGMTPREVRDRFVAPAPNGRWRTSSGDGDLVLDWFPENTPGPTSAPSASPARFEFHAGLLVAARLDVLATDPDAIGSPLVVSTATVLARRGSGNGRVEVTLLARECPTHAAEVRRLLGSR